jgi:hypothetical protein
MPFVMPRISRIALSVQYGLLAAAGTWLMTDPSQLLETTMGQIVYGWAAFLVVGGSLSLVSTLTKIWAGEFLGLILLVFANLMWGGALLNNGGNSQRYGLVLIAWAFGFVFRWGEIVGKVRKAVSAEANQPGEGRRG